MKNCTYEELLKDMNILGRYCDLVRTVDHQSCRVCTLKKENGRVTAEYGDSCYLAWNRDSRCRSCISADTVSGAVRTKLEYTNGKIFCVRSESISVEGTEICLETAKNITDSISPVNGGIEKAEHFIRMINSNGTRDPLTGLYKREFCKSGAEAVARAISRKGSPAVFAAAVSCPETEPVAYNGMLCAASDMITNAFGGIGAVFRYSDNIFTAVFAADSSEDAEAAAAETEQRIRSMPLLFREKIIPVHVKTAVRITAAPENVCGIMDSLARSLTAAEV